MAAIYIRTREELHPYHYATPNVFASSCLRPSIPAPAFLPSFFSFPPYIPPRSQPRPLVASASPFPSSLPRASLRCGCVSVLWMLHRAPLAALLSVDHQARPPPFVLPSVKFSFRRARCSGYFVPFCHPILCLPYNLHAAVSARRYTQRKQAYL